ncbi:hypothetical protein AAW51_2560 [Caldimonas brevitalea]|uniref:Uncharacterized protein n=1 Tax=Caldimonas brevitalea TaxID=413882 RepID=A0A0G3BPD1_9BURK|nr:hypothetical protein AAW51_2560 [Caldimonas brevitalea]
MLSAAARLFNRPCPICAASIAGRCSSAPSAARGGRLAVPAASDEGRRAMPAKPVCCAIRDASRPNCCRVPGACDATCPARRPKVLAAILMLMVVHADKRVPSR